MSIIDIIVFLVFLYLAFSLARWVLKTIWRLVSWVFSFIDPRPAARYRRIVKRTKARHKALSDIYVSEMQHITDQAADNIHRR